ncbi:MAG TPA: hypothetical protein PL009_08415 [Flavipsychrobacter sp.]|nr:hypothetical protein [Flavipsychrobacter sp.]
MKKKVFMLPVVLFASCFFSCNKSSSPEPDQCGAPVSKTKSLAASAPIVFNAGDWSESNILFSTNGQERTFIVMVTQADLCPQELVDISYSVKTANSSGSLVALDITGRAEWGEGHSKEVICCKRADGNMKANYEYKSFISANMKSEEITQPKTMKALLRISFHTLGNTALDTSYFRSKFQEMSVSISGRSQ